MKQGKIATAEQLFLELTGDWFEENWGEGAERSYRVGVFSAATTCWLLLVEKLRSEHRLEDALRAMSEGAADLHLRRFGSRSKRVHEGKISENTGGYSRARSRLPEGKVEALHEVLAQAVMRKLGGEGKSFFVDGTLINLQRNAEICRLYPLGRNQHGQMQTPQLLVLLAHETESGVAAAIEFGPSRGPKATSEQELFKALVQKLPSGSLLIGDRNFGISAVAHCAVAHGHQVLFRLTTTRAKKWVKQFSAGELDCPVTWETKSGEAVRGRFIRTYLHQDGFKPLELLLFTTSSLPAQMLVAKYGERQNLETDIRSFKYTIGIERLYSRSVAMLHKELHVAVMAYNLVRALVALGAKELGIPPRKISFSRAMGIVGSLNYKIYHPPPMQSPWEWFLTALSQIKLPNRTAKRTEPRKVVYRKKHFPLMRESRKKERAFVLKTRALSK